MDLLTQGLIGAGLAQAGARRDEIHLATGIGLVAGLLADADILIQSSSDPLLQIEYHRHFTHSIFFIPLGALIAALLLWPVIRQQLPLSRVYLYSLLGYSLSGFLDVCTSYGTYWFWPLLDQRLAFNLISIIDPLFTGILLTGVIRGWRGNNPVASRVALLLAGCYLLLGWFQHDRAQQEMFNVATARGHSIERALVKPTLGNLLLWRSIYEAGGRFYVDAVRIGITETRVFTGESADRFHQDSASAAPPENSTLAADIKRFVDLSDGFVISYGDAGNRLGDVRYSMFPTSSKPLWGIEFDPESPEQHASYHFYRDMSSEERQLFFDMLSGRL